MPHRLPLTYHTNCTRGDQILHEQEYNTGHGVSTIPDEVRRKYAVSRASRKYNKKLVVCLLLEEGSLGWKRGIPGLCQSRRPHSHPNQHTEAERKLFRGMRHRNPNLGMVELLHRLHPPHGEPVPGDE